MKIQHISGKCLDEILVAHKSNGTCPLIETAAIIRPYARVYVIVKKSTGGTFAPVDVALGPNRAGRIINQLYNQTYGADYITVPLNVGDIRVGNSIHTPFGNGHTFTEDNLTTLAFFFKLRFMSDYNLYLAAQARSKAH